MGSYAAVAVAVAVAWVRGREVGCDGLETHFLISAGVAVTGTSRIS